MPLYEYQCQDCHRILEVIQKFSDQPLTNCPQCQGPLERLLSAPAIQFKGSGWYVTDYAKGGNGKKSSGESEAAPKKTESSTKESVAKSADSTTKGSDSTT